MGQTESEISFLRFKRVSKFYWTPDSIFFAIMLLSILLLAMFSRYVPPWIAVFISLQGFVYFVYRSFKRRDEYEILKGYIDGEIKFGTSAIEFDGNKYPLEAIEKISFSFIDQKGENINYSGRSLNANLSQGVRNTATIKFKDGKTTIIHFQLPEHFKREMLTSVLVSYTKNHLVSFHFLSSYLCHNYKEVQELKRTYFNDRTPNE